jgi:hypothetical protein
MEKKYVGGCHCGAVRIEATIDLSAGTFKCNCEMCTKTSMGTGRVLARLGWAGVMWGAQVKPGTFRLLAGEADLLDYKPDNIHHVFCRHCGVRPFAWGDNAKLGGKFYVARVYYLEGVDIDELVNAPITYYDGRHDNYNSPPAETRHL